MKHGPERADYAEIAGDYDRGRRISDATIRLWLDVVHRFFPPAVGVDEERTPTIEAVEGWLAEAGFRAGIDRLTEYVARRPDDPWLVHDRMALTMARSPA